MASASCVSSCVVGKLGNHIWRRVSCVPTGLQCSSSRVGCVTIEWITINMIANLCVGAGCCGISDATWNLQEENQDLFGILAFKWNIIMDFDNILKWCYYNTMKIGDIRHDNDIVCLHLSVHSRDPKLTTHSKKPNFHCCLKVGYTLEYQMKSWP